VIGASIRGPSSRIFIGRGLALVAGLITVLVTARALGPEGRGHVATFAVLISTASAVLGLGAGVAAYSLAARDGIDPIELGQTLVLWAVGVLGGSAALAVLAAGSGLLEAWLGSGDEGLVLLLGVGAGGQFLTVGLIQLSTGTGRATTTAVGFGLPAILVALATIVVTAAGPRADRYMFAQAAGWIASAIVLAVMLAIPLVPRSVALRAIVTRGRSAAIGDVANILSYRLDVLLLGLLSGSAAVGIYSLAVQILEPVWIVATSASNGLLIRFRDLPADAWAGATYRTARSIVLLTCLIAGAAVLLVPVAIAITGAGFRGAQTAAAALLPGIVMLAGSKILAAFHIASGRLGLSSGIATTSLACTTIADLSLMPFLGATGAAVASSIGYGLSMALWLIVSPRGRSASSRAA
jgi:O-antigen/teichoic acid export membrane protein